MTVEPAWAVPVTVGVVTLVIRSVEEAPLSLAAVSAGVAGAGGAATTVTVPAVPSTPAQPERIAVTV